MLEKSLPRLDASKKDVSEKQNGAFSLKERLMRNKMVSNNTEESVSQITP